MLSTFADNIVNFRQVLSTVTLKPSCTGGNVCGTRTVTENKYLCTPTILSTFADNAVNFRQVLSTTTLKPSCSGDNACGTRTVTENKYLLTPGNSNDARLRSVLDPGVVLRANLKSISHRCHLLEVAFVRELTKETIHLPLVCL